MKAGTDLRSNLKGRPRGYGWLRGARGKGYGTTARRPALSTMVVVGALFVSVAQPMTSPASAQQHDAPAAAPVTFPQHAHQITVSLSTEAKAAVSGAVSSSAVAL